MATREVITRGYGFANTTLFIPTRGYGIQESPFPHVDRRLQVAAEDRFPLPLAEERFLQAEAADRFYVPLYEDRFWQAAEDDRDKGEIGG